MSFNTFGHLFRFTSFGESHGPAIGCVVDGCPPQIPLEAAEIKLIWTSGVRANRDLRLSGKSLTR